MSNKNLFLVDTFLVQEPFKEQASKDALSILKDSSKPSLRIVVDATHSGLYTNRKVYPGKKVQNSYKSYFSKENGGTAEYNKPFLLHHNEHADPVGRIARATFTPLKSGNAFDYDFLNPDKEGKGSGVVTVEGTIVDPEAISKILDGRYITVSSGHSTTDYTCSVCGHSLTKSDECDHTPGKTYENDSGEDVVCFAITSDLEYHEISFVNLPAQPVAKIISALPNTDWNMVKGVKDIPTILSYVDSQPDSIKSLILQDSIKNISFDLLTGKETTRKGKLTVSTAVTDKVKKLIVGSEGSETPTTAKSDGADSRPNPSEPVSKGAGDQKTSVVIDNQKTNAPQPEDRASQSRLTQNTSSKGNKMADKIELSQDAVNTMLDALKTEADGLRKANKDLTDKVSSVEAASQAKDSEIQRLTNDLSVQSAEMTKILATSLAHTRISLKKADTKSIDSKEKLDSYIENLGKRSIDSLKDALADIALEQPISNSTRNIADVAADSKVTSPLLETKSKDEKGIDTTKSGKARLAEALTI